jgi:hypothetical protein
VVELDRCATDTMTAARDSLAWLTAPGHPQSAQRQSGP